MPRHASIVSRTFAMIIGCSARSRRSRNTGSANARSRNQLRSMAPSGCRHSVPNASTTAVWPASPGADTAWATASASTTSAPRSANAFATSDLPLPIPPVNPTTYGTSVRARTSVEIDLHQARAEEQRYRTRDGEIRSERQRYVVIAPLEHDQHDADDCADHGREQHDER